MKEKTLRYPGHREYIEVLRNSGLFSKEFIDVKGKSIRPIDVTSTLLFPRWKLGKKEKEFTFMRIEMETGQMVLNFELWDEYDEEEQVTSMARTTGFTCTSLVQLLLENKIDEGIITPEEIGGVEKYFNFLIERLKSKGIRITTNKSSKS